MLYLIDPNALHALRENQHLAPTAAERLAFDRNPSSGVRGVASTDGGTATIAIEGVLTPRPDLFARLFGGGNTSYASICDALVSAKSDPSVRRVVLKISSPGGTVDGLFETLEAIKDFKATGKAMSVVSNYACSAAYAIAAVAGSIDAVGDWASFGSVGVAASFLVNDKIVDVASTDAPNKRPDLTTADGKAVVRKQLDDIHALFVGYIAAGRGLSTSTNFGRGGVVLAREAKKLKMIDSIGGGSAGSAGSVGSSAHAGPAMQKALELRALMGGATPQKPARKIAGVVAGCGSGPNGDMGDAVADLMFGSRGTHASADIVADGERDMGDAVANLMLGGPMPKTPADHLAGLVRGSKNEDMGDDVADCMLGRTKDQTQRRSHGNEEERDLGDDIAELMLGRS